MSRDCTLLELLKDFYVEIPRVQRDYAQGREDSKSTAIRERFVDDLISLKQGSLDLNFIYGKTIVKGSDKIFYPVDGQQRLTTLFLLHIYVFANDESKTHILNKFSYQARTTTRDFFIKLIENRSTLFKDDNVERAIYNSEWFLYSYRYDPSIQGVIRMLQTMVDAVKKQDIKKKDIKDLLLSNLDKIYFKFIEIENLGQEDSLYIKLNARGKPLTPFENFKSNYVETLQNLDLEDDIKAEYIQNLDCSFSDYIFSEVTSLEDTNKETLKNFDKCYLNFFSTVFENNNITQDTKNLYLSHHNLFSQDTWIYNFNYAKIEKEMFIAINNILSFLSNKEEQTKIKKLIKIAIKKDNLSYADKIMFHVVFCYFYKQQNNDINIEHLLSLIRIFNNLVQNSTLDTKESFNKALLSVKKFIVNLGTVNSIEESFVKIEALAGFLGDQIKEEKLKAKLILKNCEYKKAIIEAENNLPYFLGQIYLALYFACTEDIKGAPKDKFTALDVEKFDLNRFNTVVKKLKLLFKTNQDLILLRCALLSFKDYRLNINSLKTLCVDDNKEAKSVASLKKLFNQASDVVCSLINSLDEDKGIEQLNKIIDKNIQGISQSDFRYCIIQYKDYIFSHMSKQYYKMIGENRAWYWSYNEECLLKRATSRGDSFSLYLKALEAQLGSSLQNNIVLKHDEKEDRDSNFDKYIEFSFKDEEDCSYPFLKVQLLNSKKIFTKRNFIIKRDDKLKEKIQETRYFTDNSSTNFVAYEISFITDDLKDKFNNIKLSYKDRSLCIEDSAQKNTNTIDEIELYTLLQIPKENLSNYDRLITEKDGKTLDNITSYNLISNEDTQDLINSGYKILIAGDKCITHTALFIKILIQYCIKT